MSAVDRAFEATPRVDFLPPAERHFAAVERALPIGHGQTCSQPAAVRAMLELLDVAPGQRVLDVGAGSGWTTALLATLVGPSGAVVGVELEPELTRRAAARVAATGRTWARVEQAVPGRLGWPAEAPYDRVLVSAEAPEVPAELLAQLAPGGVMVLPVAGRMLQVATTVGGEPTVSEHGHYLFVPLR
ncbi:protein-L-isoaspartate O-methyltransferase family protein [Oryzihumus leptocrescens]|uniref:protein-L-isoaspartate O-methyltransferase family protein n=1 Tax=Oryzihumus leptocrescens TaxID=297536 RepID=UPI00115060A1|nr:methyltransferase domain-containing protein [Oryzihumus leptocrescens]